MSRTVKISLDSQRQAARHFLNEIDENKKGFSYQAVTKEGKVLFCNGKVWMLLNELSPVLDTAFFIEDTSWVLTPDNVKYNFLGLTPTDKTITDIYTTCVDYAGEITPKTSKVWVSRSNPIRLKLNEHYNFIPFVIKDRCYNAQFLNDVLCMICSKMTESAELYINKHNEFSPLLLKGTKGTAFILPIRMRKSALNFYKECTKEVIADEN